MKISIFFLIFSVSIFSDASKQVDVISCDEDIKLIIDEENMTNEEILKAKDEYFKKLLAQANQECISKKAMTSNLNVKQTNAGGSISGSDIQRSTIKTSSSTLSTPKINEVNKKISSNTTQPVLNNGALPPCISKIKDSNQVSVQLKEAIAKETDANKKKELIKSYAIYNNIDPETLKC
tara:strand:+ start:1626 stop:2162 length:537 start_codon:yes stop_codon:yes gene_type:complete